jgi:glycosyltransferase involved in cell wall biosynthesis
MKVLMLPPGYYPIRGGAETVVRNLSLALNRIGIQTDIMTFNMDRKYSPRWRGKTERIDGLTVYKIPAISWMRTPSPRINMKVNLIPGRFVSIMRNYDIVHFHEADFSFPLFSFLVKKPKILHLHGLSLDYFRRYHLSRAIFKHVASYYITITRQMGKDLAELGMTRNRIIYLPNSIDVNSFCPDGEKSDNLLLYLGRIVPVKGLHILLASLRYVKQPVRLAIAGPVGDMEYYKKVMKQIQEENKRGLHIVTYLGTIAQQEVVKLYRSSSVLVLPSSWEAFPMAILEALSCETPVIATPVGANSEIIGSHTNGILVPVNDPLKLAEAVSFILENRDRRIEMGKKGRESVVKNYSVEATADRLSKIYRKIVNE